MRYLQLTILIYRLVLIISFQPSQIHLFQSRNQQRFIQKSYYQNKVKKEYNKRKYTDNQISTYNKDSKIKYKINQQEFHNKSYKLVSQSNLVLKKREPNIKISNRYQVITKHSPLLKIYQQFQPLQTSTNGINNVNSNCIYFSAVKANCLNNQKYQQKSIQKQFQFDSNVKQITLYQIIKKTAGQSRIESQKINLRIPQNSPQHSITTELPIWYLNPEPEYQVSVYNNTKENNSLTNKSIKNSTQQLNQTSRAEIPTSNLSIDEVILAPLTIFENFSDEFRLNASVDLSLLPTPSISSSDDILRSSLINAQYQTSNPIMFIGQTSLQARNGISTQKIRQLISTSRETSIPLNINNSVTTR